MSLLDQIIENKRKEVEESKLLQPIKQLEKSHNFELPTSSLKRSLQRNDKTGIIAEFKRKSPSKGIINALASVETTTTGYIQAGASALSVLTDKLFFNGSNDDLITARKFNLAPILRKDFIIDEYQVVEAKSIGADVILLIAAVLDARQIKMLTKLAHSLKLDVLLEVHDEQELVANLDADVDLVGVNNRNLKTFEVSLETSKRLVDKIPQHVVKVSESGIERPEDVLELRQFGYEGFLIGERFMKSNRPDEEARQFMDALRKQF